MNRMNTRNWILLAAIIAASIYAVAESKPTLNTVSHVELDRYLGRWYEIARYPNWFEKKCARDVTATYALRPDGKISIQNACLKQDGARSESTGWARIADPSTNAKLKVTFFWPFFGDYWILDLGPNYEYAVVGEPSREYLWILSRTPQLSDEQYRAITEKLSAKGYNAAKLIRIPQSSR